MAAIVYGLCAITSAICALLLLRSYFTSRARLLLWSTVGFAGLFANNVLLFVDFIAAPGAELALARHATAALSLSMMLFGLLWEGR